MSARAHAVPLADATVVARRRTIRRLAAIASAATAVLYFGIGGGILKVVDESSLNGRGLFEFGVSAGVAFVVGATLLLALDRRVFWVFGAILQVGVIVMYIAVAPQRTPPFELWGIVIKVLQASILAGLTYLVLSPTGRRTGAEGARR